MSNTPAPTPYPPPLERKLLSPGHGTTWIAVGLLWLVGRLPRSWRFAIGSAMGRLIWRHNAKRRAIVATNLEWCFPELTLAEREALLNEFAGHFGRSYLDFGEFWWNGRKAFLRAVRFEGLEQIEQALAAGERVILAVPHTLSMDIGGMALSMRLPLTTFANSIRNPVFEWMARSRRGRFGCTIHPRAHGIRPVLRELKNGRVLFFPSDEDPGQREAETRFVPFFGIPKATLTSPVRLARTVGARIYPCSCHYDAAIGQYRVIVDAPLAQEQDTDVATAALSAAFEAAIRRAPAQYLWTQRLFQSCPDGSPPPYYMKGRPGSGHRQRPS